MRTINCIIADDEKIAREIMQTYVGKLPNLKLIAVCNNGREVNEVIKNNAIDLLFLDIQMPHLTGIELLRKGENLPQVIITTAYREFALEGYDLNVLDYLLKPISFERFLKAVDKYIKLTAPESLVATKVSMVPLFDPYAFIYIKAEKKSVRLLLKDILFIEGLKDCVKIYTTDKEVITYQTLGYLEEKLSSNYFIRVHRSYIISIQHISAFTAGHIEIGSQIIPIGGSFAAAVTARISRQ